MYKEGKEWEDPDLYDMEKRGLWRVKEKNEKGDVQGMQIGFGVGFDFFFKVSQIPLYMYGFLRATYALMFTSQLCVFA